MRSRVVLFTFLCLWRITAARATEIQSNYTVTINQCVNLGTGVSNPVLYKN
jgi:hypothetical protein